MAPVARRTRPRRGDRYDAVVVGAGLAGCAAAIAMTAAGLRVALIERAPTPGSKNAAPGQVSGADLAALLGDDWQDAPLERRITEERRWHLSDDLRTELSSRPDHHLHTVVRHRLDAWLAGRAEAAGARLLTGCLVDGLVVEGDRVAGVIAGGDVLSADVVILATGLGLSTSLLERPLPHRQPLRTGLRTDEVLLGVSEVIRLAPATIQARFECAPSEGVVIRCSGEANQGLPEFLSIATNQDSVTVAGGVRLSELVATRRLAAELLDRFKDHPAVRPLVAGGETIAFASGLIPAVPRTGTGNASGDGYLVCGDAALASCAAEREGCSEALRSGHLAGATVVELKERARPPAARFLAEYEMRLLRAMAQPAAALK